MVYFWPNHSFKDASSDGSGSKIFDRGRANFLWLGSDKKKSLRVRSESTQVRGGSASYLLRVKSKLGSGRVGSGPISRCFFFILYYLLVKSNSAISFDNNNKTPSEKVNFISSLSLFKLRTRMFIVWSLACTKPLAFGLALTGHHLLIIILNREVFESTK